MASVLVDIQGTQSVEHADRGIARYVGELAVALDSLPSEHVESFLLNPELAVPAAVERLRRSDRVRFADRVESTTATAYHVCSPFELLPLAAIFPRWARRLRLIVTLYDLIPLLYPETHLTDPYLRARYFARLELVRSADRILAISETSARDAVDHLGVAPDRITVVGTGVSDRFAPPGDRGEALAEARRELPWLEDGFVLHVGGTDPRKNTERLIEAYGRLPEGLRAAHQLVIACSLNEAMRDRIRAAARRVGASERVRLTGFVPDPLLVRLYQACSLFVFPSVYEGFGLPVAEAAACGARVVSSGTPAAAQAGEEAELCDPLSVSSISDAMRRQLERPPGPRGDPPQVERWCDVAERADAEYARLTAPRRARSRRARLAVVSPLPPQPSGVAGYSARLISALSELCDVDAYADSAQAPAVLAASATALRSSSFELAEAALGGYDAVVYCLGNSGFHVDALRLLRRRPGIVLAHDVRFTNLYDAACRNDPDGERRSFGALVASLYGDDVAAAVAPQGRLDPDAAARLGVYMAREAIERAELFLVHSEHAAGLAAREAPPGASGKIRVLPFAAPPVRAPGPPPARPPLVVSVGYVDPVKRTATLIRAFARLGGRAPDAQLAVVGPVDERERRRLLELARELGVGERTTITGAVDAEELGWWLEQATVSVQLRAWSNGESSASVLEALAAGLPVVTSSVGALAELPDDCVVKVPPQASPDAVAAAIAEVLGDEERRRGLVERGLAYCATRSFADAARALLELAVERSRARAS